MLGKLQTYKLQTTTFYEKVTAGCGGAGRQVMWVITGRCADLGRAERLVWSSEFCGILLEYAECLLSHASVDVNESLKM